MRRLTVRKAIVQIHLWLGLASGLVVMVLGITGAIYALSDEIKDIVYRDRLTVSPGDFRLPLSILLQTAQKELGPDRPITRAELPNAPERTYMFRAVKIDKQAIGYGNYYAYYDKVYVNPYNGKVVYHEDATKEFFTVVLALHMHLLLGDRIGHPVIMVSVICFVVLLLTGIVLWWPRKWNRRTVRQQFTVKLTGTVKRMIYDLHNVPGFFACLVLLIIAYTGLMWSFDLTAIKTRPVSSDTILMAATAPVDAIFEQVQKAAPQAAYFLYNFPTAKAGTANISAYLSDVTLYNRVQYKYDRYNGRLLQKGDQFKTLSAGNKMKALNYDLHTGSVLGLAGKVLVCLAGLVAASLPVTGFLIWWGKKKKRHGLKKQPFLGV